MLDPMSGANQVELGSTVNELRTNEAKQGWFERIAQARSVKGFFNAIFGTTPEIENLTPQLCGSDHVDINIGEVVQTSQTDQTPQGTRTGLGSARGDGNLVHQKCNEHGFILVLVSHTVESQYYQGVEKMWIPKKSYLDYPTIDFANIGNESILQKEINFGTQPSRPFNMSDQLITGEPVFRENLGNGRVKYNGQGNPRQQKVNLIGGPAHYPSVLNVAQKSGTSLDNVFGYVPRFSTYKFKLDQCHGVFKYALKYWQSFRKFNSQPILSHEFVNWEFLADSEELNKMFVVQADYLDSKFLLDIFINSYVSRALPYINDPPVQTSQQHQQTQSQGSTVEPVASAAKGLVSSGPWGLAVGALDFGRDLFKDWRNKRNRIHAQEDARENAQLQYRNQLGLSNSANEWNREANQVLRYREAGLSPGLMYGQMSPSTSSSGSASMPDTPQAVASSINENPALLQALQYLLQKQQVGADVDLISSQIRKNNAETNATSTDTLSLHERNLQTIQESIARMAEMASNVNLNDAQRDRIQKLLDQELAALEATVNKTSAEATYISGTQTDLGQSQIKVNDSQAEYITDYQAPKTDEEIRKMSMENEKIASSINYIKDFLRNHNLDPNLLGSAVGFLESMDNWVQVYNNYTRNETIKQAMDRKSASGETEKIEAENAEAIYGKKTEEAEYAKNIIIILMVNERTISRSCTRNTVLIFENTATIHLLKK
ncbi:unnamed protein product [Cylicocyclus nassatus]|uniref:Uncharacterized protein n=1 Tax=Cylicocyclus nassatus TaxID=53992 RepID=A0AA36HH15_CYLNA|nr:unnamed protein product [Cylicocyclus nassatus]